MNFKDLQDLASKKKRKKERIKAVKKLAVGMGVVAVVGVATGVLFATKSGKKIREDLKRKSVNTIETIKGTVQKKADKVKDSTSHAVQEVGDVIKDVHGKTEGVKKDIKVGFHDITKDIHKTAENISDEFNKSVK